MTPTISNSLTPQLRTELTQVPPFMQMQQDDVDFFINNCEERNYEPQAVVIESTNRLGNSLFFIRRGRVVGEDSTTACPALSFTYEPGDLFPLEAYAQQDATLLRYRSAKETSVLVIPRSAIETLAARSATFASFLNSRIYVLLEQSRREVQTTLTSQIIKEQSLDTPLSALALRPVVTCSPDTPLHKALTEIHARKIGAMLVTNNGGRPVGILTQSDILGRITLAHRTLEEPISQAMTFPVVTLESDQTVQAAISQIAGRGIRHLPVTRNGRLVGVVSERDLFALQRLSVRQLSIELQRAPTMEAVKSLAPEIKRLAVQLLALGVQSKQLTALISQLNDLLTRRLVELAAQIYNIDLSKICWLALGSEGRHEQTISTDQDNALILADDAEPVFVDKSVVFAKEVNQFLAACGYPLCRGGIMAGSAGGTAKLLDWRQRFSRWIEQGSPNDLLNASIYFDLRCIVGSASLAQELRRDLLARTQKTPRFLKQMAINALQHSAPVNWFGLVDTDAQGCIDLKLQGTLAFVNAARIYALAYGIEATNTSERIEEFGRIKGLSSNEFKGWIGGFEYLQLLRLRNQLESSSSTLALRQPNRIRLTDLNDLDRRVIRESLKIAQSLQERLQLDYDR